MLDKEICKNCINLNRKWTVYEKIDSKWNGYDEDRWKEKFIVYQLSLFNIKRTIIEIPGKCLYKLEQIVSWNK